MNVSAYSQSWQPNKIKHNNKEGLFLPFGVMDTISFKLIERNSLIGLNSTLGELLSTLQDKNNELTAKAFNKLKINNVVCKTLKRFYILSL